MKKAILIAASTIFSTVLFSQAKLEVGLKGGANFANPEIENVNSESITSFHGGAFVLIKVASFGIQPEILYSSQGSEVSGASDINLDYINVPVMAKLYLPLGLNFQLGPQFGILSNNLQDLDGDGAKEELKSADLSAAFGAGWDLPFGLKIDARYILGLSNINDDPTYNGDVRNRMFQLSLGYSLFKIGR
ncbi:MAG: porin family protein [Bacteroidota bacterium]